MRVGRARRRNKMYFQRGSFGERFRPIGTVPVEFNAYPAADKCDTQSELLDR